MYDARLASAAIFREVARGIVGERLRKCKGEIFGGNCPGDMSGTFGGMSGCSRRIRRL